MSGPTFPLSPKPPHQPQPHLESIKFESYATPSPTQPPHSPTPPPPILCANCELNISGKENEDRFTEFALVDPDDLDKEEELVGGCKYVNVTQAIAKVFGALIKLNNVDMPDPSVFVMCHQCITSLGELYRYYIGFLESTSDASVIQTLLSPISPPLAIQDHDEDQVTVQNKPLTKDIGISVNLDKYQPLVNEALVKSDQHHAFEPACSDADTETSEHDAEVEMEEHSEYIVPEIKIPTRILTRSMTRGSKRSAKKKHKKKPTTRKNSTGYKFKCSKVQCLKKFRDEESFLAHLATHSKPSRDRDREQVIKTKTVFKCEECGKAFRSGKLYRRHRKFKHGEGMEHLTPEEIQARKCEQCSRIFGIPSQLANHIKNVHATDKPFDCTFCDKKFPSQNYLSIHRRMKHRVSLDPNDPEYKGSKDYKSKITQPQTCTFCEEEYQRLVDLKVHLREKHPGEKFICSYEGCNKAFRCIRLFRRHKKIKHGEGLTEEVKKQLTCQLCDKVFGIPSQLRAHIDSVHATEKNISCDLCPAMFPTVNRLKIHKFTKHKDPAKSSVQLYKCDKCDKTYNSASGYQYHIDTVHLQKATYSFVCEHCGKKFARSDWLKAHQLIHEPNRPKPFQCTECLQLFLTRKNLIAHRKVHSGKKDLLCSICGKDFLHSQSLKRHILARHASDLPETGTISVSGTIVSQPQPHVCNQCGKTFKFREYLLQHLRSKTHGGKGHTAQRRREERLPTDAEETEQIPESDRVTIAEVIDETDEIEMVPQQIQVIETKGDGGDGVTESSYFVQLLIQQ